MQPAPYQDQWLRETFPLIGEPALLGAGGQKTVYAVSHAKHGACVLKLFHLGSETARAEREISAITSLHSPRVPRVLEHGEATTAGALAVVWLLEERVPGRTLRSIVTDGPAPNQELTFLIARHVLEALVAAESHRIVHRDVKPENIVVDEASKAAWLLDFGIARHLDLSSLTATANIFGPCTPGYAPPEQFRNLKTETDSRSDLFSLGVTLYEVVEGLNPFTAGARDAREKFLRTMGEALPPISKGIGANLAFRDLVTAMTRTRRDHRPASAADALEWLNDVRLAE